MKPLRYIPHYTYEDYSRWEGKWELIYGIAHDMSPSPKRKHQQVTTLLVSAISIGLKQETKNCNDCFVYTELDWIISEDTAVRPDIMIVCGEFNDDFLKFPPTLVVEILSPSTAIKDRSVKFDLYEQQKVKYYILLNPDNKTQKIFTLQNDVYVEIQTTEFVLHNNCPLQIDFQLLLNELN